MIHEWIIEWIESVSESGPSRRAIAGIREIAGIRCLNLSKGWSVMRLIFIDFLQYMQPFPKINSVNKREGAVHILRQGEGV